MMKTILLALITILGVRAVSASGSGISRTGIDFIKQHESLSLTVYDDAGGRPTVGYGHLIKPGEDFTGGITKSEADSLLRQDIAKASNALSMVKVPLTSKQRDALISLIFNIGRGAFARSTLLKVLNTDDYQGAAIQFRRWNKIDGEPSQGLSKRRIDETIMFLKGTKQ